MRILYIEYPYSYILFDRMKVNGVNLELIFNGHTIAAFDLGTYCIKFIKKSIIDGEKVYRFELKRCF